VDKPGHDAGGSDLILLDRALESGTACPLDRDRQGARIQVAFAAQAFRDDQRLRNCRRIAGPTTPQGLCAEFAKRLTIETRNFR
jgi:hypothetical protein